jgi:hypothetical protein
MKGLATISGIVLAMALSPCAQSESSRSNTLQRDSTSAATNEGLPCESMSYENVIEKQDRINRYFHRTVAPLLMSCWEGLSSKGTVAVSFVFRRDGDLWVPGDSTLQRSTLAEGQDKLAMYCLQDAVRDTFFEAGESDREAQELTINWNFPVPWPKDATEMIQLAIDTGGGGGCGGEALKSCQNCKMPLGLPSSCAKVCVGYTDCKVNSDQNGCTMGPKSPQCVSGSTFYNVGGLVMY